MSDAPPGKVQEYANQTIVYVQRALKVPLEYDSETLPILDHYLRGVPRDQPATVELVILTAGAYFGEVLRRRLGGRWELAEDPKSWRMVLPSSINFSPAGMVAAAIAQEELADVDTALDAPPRMRQHLHEALQRMGQLAADEFYSLCGRLDTIEHLHEVLVSVAAAALGSAGAEQVEEATGDLARESGASDDDATASAADADAAPSDPLTN